MRLRPIALGLLLGFAFSVMTAAYPCAVVVPHQASPAAAKTSCLDGMAHRHASPAHPAKHRGCCDPRQSRPKICQKACHGVAVLRLPAALPAPEPRMEAASAAAERSLSLFVASIDHIPLA